MTVYADILFLVNASMDFITLLLAVKLTGGKTTKLRLVAAAAVGGILGTLAFFLPESVIFSLLSGAVISFVSCTVAYVGKRSVRRRVRECLTVWGAGTLLGGVMTAVLSLGEPIFFTGADGFVPTVALTASLAWLFLGSLGRSSRTHGAEVKFTVAGREYAADGFVDSGSFLAEPISSLPVIVISADVAGELCERVYSLDGLLKVRVIPVSTLSSDGVIYGFIPDSLTVGGIERTAVIGVLREKKNFGGYSAIVPPSLA